MGAAVPTAAEMIRRARICLSEVGYHDIEIVVTGTLPDGRAALGTSDPIPPAIAYQVGVLDCQYTTSPPCCWSCWLAAQQGYPGLMERCRAGNCAHPEGPPRPPREELVGRG